MGHILATSTIPAKRTLQSSQVISKVYETISGLSAIFAFRVKVCVFSYSDVLKGLESKVMVMAVRTEASKVTAALSGLSRVSSRAAQRS